MISPRLRTFFVPLLESFGPLISRKGAKKNGRRKFDLGELGRGTRILRVDSRAGRPCHF
jgi:hypothetical protein